MGIQISPSLLAADFANLEPDDLHGVTCHMCHRMADPIARTGAPAIDA